MLMGWLGLHQDVLVLILEFAGHSTAPSLRLVCQAWREAVDSSLVRLSPPRWPSQYACARIMHHVSSLDCSRLSLAADAACTTSLTHPGCREKGSPTITPGATQVEAAGSSCISRGSSTSSSQLDLMGAAVLQPRMQQQSYQTSSHSQSAAALAAAPGPPAASSATSLMCYVASAWPEAVPHVTQAACLRLWKHLPQLQWLQHLQLSGSMLLIRSVSTSVAGCPDAAAGLRLLQQHAADSSSGSHQAPIIIHTYTLEVPPALCCLTRLQSLSIDWHLPAGQDSSSGGGAAVFTRRRSYEGGGSDDPLVQHKADPTIKLPQEFSRLVHLRSLQLVGHVARASTLLPLTRLTHLQQLVLGPGRISMQALLPLAAAGVLGGLTQLSLKQQASWHMGSVVSVLAAATKLQQLEVQELGMTSAELSTTAQLQQALTAAAVAPLANSLTRLCWSTCGQRLAAGASLLCRSPAAAGLPGQPGDTSAAAAGTWLGALSALQSLELTGILREGSVLGAPALDAISSSVGGCSRLQKLAINGLGLPLLPQSLGQLQQLSHVSIEAYAVTRRAVLGPEAALAVLGQCTALQELTLAGCELRHVPQWLAGLQRMTALQLHGNYLQDLPAGLPCMGLPPALQRLDLADNRLRELPCSITQLTSLTRLIVDSNYLTTLPASFWELPAIREVSAQENMLSCLPECSPWPAAGHKCCSSCSSQCAGMVGCGSGSCRRAVGAPTALAATAAPSFAPAQPVEASAVGRAQPFAGLGPLSAEEEDLLGAIGFLQVSTSRQASLSRGGELLPHAAACAAGAVAVEAAAGRECQCYSQHQRARRCACAGSLRSLVLADNQLTELPASISQLGSLRELDLSKNQLRSLPDKSGLWALTGLTSLQLADNHLHKLPGRLALLQGLVELDVSGNHLAVSVVAGRRSMDAAAAATPAAAAGMAVGAPVQARTAAPAVSASGASSSSAAHRPAQECAAAASPAPSEAGRPAGAPNSPALVTVHLQDCVPACAPSSAACSNSMRAVREPPAALPCPLGRLPSLQQVRLGRQSEGSSKCPLQLLLDGLFDLAERIRCLGPIKRQCPVAKAAAAAVAHITGVTSSRRAKALRRQEELLRRMQSEQEWAAGPKLPAAGP